MQPEEYASEKIAELEYAAGLIRVRPDFPSPGVLFRDVTPMLCDGRALQTIATALTAPFAEFDVIAGIEARGFLLAGAAGVAAGVGAVAVRKAGKLPDPAASASYDLEYGSATVEVQADIAPGTRVLIVDDALATGGTADAARRVIEQIGGEVVGCAVLLEIPGLGGREKLADLPLHVVFPNSDAETAE